MTASITSISRKGDPDRPALSRGPEAADSPKLSDRVVVQYGGRALRGFTDRQAWEGALENGLSLEQLPFRGLDADSPNEISLAGLKAAFFVKRFDGPGLDEMRFHDRVSPMTSLWVRVVFRDGEIIEGLVDNKCGFVLQAGFFLTPTDPDANHSLIYVAKGQLREFQVLGLRSVSARAPGLAEGA